MTPEELEKLVADIVAKQMASVKEVVPKDVPEVLVGKVVVPKKLGVETGLGNLWIRVYGLKAHFDISLDELKEMLKE